MVLPENGIFICLTEQNFPAAVLLPCNSVLRKARSNENNRRAAALIQSYRSNGMNWLSIANELNNAGFKTSRGKAFHAVQVQRIYKGFN